MKNPLILVTGFVGVGLVLFGFTRKDGLNKTYFESNTDEMLNVLDKNLTFSNAQIKTLAKQIREQNAGNYQKHILLKAWKGLISLDLEGQLSDKGTLTFEKMQDIASALDRAIDNIFNRKNRAITSYCQQNGFSVTDRIFTIEDNLLKLASEL